MTPALSWAAVLVSHFNHVSFIECRGTKPQSDSVHEPQLLKTETGEPKRNRTHVVCSLLMSLSGQNALPARPDRLTVLFGGARKLVRVEFNKLTKTTETGIGLRKRLGTR